MKFRVVVLWCSKVVCFCGCSNCRPLCFIFSYYRNHLDPLYAIHPSRHIKHAKICKKHPYFSLPRCLYVISFNVQKCIWYIQNVVSEYVARCLPGIHSMQTFPSSNNHQNFNWFTWQDFDMETWLIDEFIWLWYAVYLITWPQSIFPSFSLSWGCWTPRRMRKKS